jgi:hypothetical protein
MTKGVNSTSLKQCARIEYSISDTVAFSCNRCILLSRRISVRTQIAELSVAVSSGEGRMFCSMNLKRRKCRVLTYCRCLIQYLLHSKLLINPILEGDGNQEKQEKAGPECQKGGGLATQDTNMSRRMYGQKIKKKRVKLSTYLSRHVDNSPCGGG